MSQQSRQVTKVGVVGLGTMGAGIAEVFARSGLQVVGLEPAEDALERGRGHLRRSTDRAVARGKLSAEEQAAVLGRVAFTTSVEDLAEVDLAIEAVPERLGLKRDVFSALDKACRPDAILATNTSSLSVTEIAVTTSRPSQVVGMHFFNPAPVQRLVEVVRTVVTADEVVDDVRALAVRLGKSPVVIGDRAGFIANALLFGYLNRAIAMVESRYARREDVDAAMTLGAGLPMGPLALLDLIGLDTAYSILEAMYAQSRDRLHAPAPLLRQMVAAGLLGRKTGRGFYTYEPSGPPVVGADAPTSAAPDEARVEGRPVQTVGVIGPGTTAGRIAGALRTAGYDVVEVPGMQDTGVRDLADRDLVVASAEDDTAATRALFAALDRVCRPSAVLAGASSLVPVVECAAATGRPQDVVGLHLADRSPGSRLAEVVTTVSTGADVVATMTAVCERLGRHPVVCADRAGFLLDALLFPHLNDAVRMLEARYADVDDIDTAMKAGCGYPRGPFEVLEAIGLDVALAQQQRLYEEFREPSLAPAPLLGQLVTAGRSVRTLGRASSG